MKLPTTHGAMVMRISFVVVLATATVRAGDVKSAIVREPAPSRWRFGAAYAPLLGLDTEFKGLGTFGFSSPVQLIAPGTSYEYDNGYVRVDSSGNLNGETWNWGYEDATQVNDNHITMSITSSNADARARENNDASHGVDLFAYLEMGPVELAGRRASWGFRTGLHYARIDIGNNSTLVTGTTSVTDTYTGIGVIPGAPYSGSFDGPGPRLDDTPIRDLVAGTALVSGSRDLDVHLTTLNCGSYMEFPVAENLHVFLEGGLSIGFASGDYKFDSTTTIPGLGTAQSAGSASDTRILPGLYFGLSGAWQINPSCAVQLSGRYQYMDSFSLHDNGSSATLSFDSAFVLSVGILHTF